ncbi:MAG TPA: RNA methyltransferase [Gammaproteobacteria bacterium]|jgi:TrmH family RNA methyltransferase
MLEKYRDADDIPVRIVLVEPSHAGNIGAAARAMKTMGLKDLVLVAPKSFPSAEATARASGADDILAAATLTESLGEALGDYGYVVGASARHRSLKWPTVDARSCAERLWRRAAETSVAVVFGPEQSGLTNEQLARCHALVHIPSNAAYSSLNLAMAVQVICYELRMSRPAASPTDASEQDDRDAPLAGAAELEAFHEHLEELMTVAGFLNPDHSRQLKLRLRRLFNRARLDLNEINILRGLLSALDPRNPVSRHD